MFFRPRNCYNALSGSCAEWNGPPWDKETLRKKLMITVMLITFLLAWIGLPPAARSTGVKSCAVSSDMAGMQCTQTENCPMKHRHTGAGHASMHGGGAANGGKSCDVSYHCGTKGKNEGKGLLSQFKDSPFLTGGVTLSGILTAERLAMSACAAYSDPVAALRDRPPASHI